MIDARKLQWNPPAFQYRNGIISNYTVLLQYESINGTKDEIKYFTDQEELVIERDADSLMVQVMVSAHNQVGEGPAATLVINGESKYSDTSNRTYGCEVYKIFLKNIF